MVQEEQGGLLVEQEAPTMGQQLLPWQAFQALVAYPAVQEEQEGQEKPRLCFPQLHQHLPSQLLLQRLRR